MTTENPFLAPFSFSGEECKMELGPSLPLIGDLVEPKAKSAADMFLQRYLSLGMHRAPCLQRGQARWNPSFNLNMAHKHMCIFMCVYIYIYTSLFRFFFLSRICSRIGPARCGPGKDLGRSAGLSTCALGQNASCQSLIP